MDFMKNMESKGLKTFIYALIISHTVLFAIFIFILINNLMKPREKTIIELLKEKKKKQWYINLILYYFYLTWKYKYFCIS